MQKFISLFLLICLLFTGCNAPKQPAEAPQQPSQTAEAVPDQAVPVESAEEESYPAYVSKPLPEPLTSATAQCLVENRLYTGGFADWTATLCWQDESGTGTVALPDGASFLYAMAPTPDGFALLYGSLPAGYLDELGNFVRLAGEPENRHGLAFYTAAGELVKTTLLAEEYDTTLGSFKDMAYVDGGFVLLHQSYLVKVDENGQELVRLSLEKGAGVGFTALASLDSGLYALRVPMLQEGTPASTLLRLNPDTLEVEAEETLDLDVRGLGTAADGGLLLNAAGAEGGIYHHSEDGALTALLLYEAVGGNLPGRKILVYGSGFLVFDQYENALSLVQWVTGVKPEPVELTLACTGSTGIETVIQEFNRSQQDYHVTAVSYGETGDFDRLRTEILAGNAPDLYLFGSYSPTAPRERAGLRPSRICRELSALVDEALFVPTVLDALAENGQYFTLPLSFAISTATAPETLIDHSGLSRAELNEIRAAHGDLPAVPRWMTAENLLALTCPFYLSKFVDESTQTCDFENQEFYDYLTWCKTWAGDGSIPPQDEQALLTHTVISNVANAVTQTEGTEETPMTYVGFPVETGYGHLLHISAEIGISNETDCPAGAEAFLTYCVEHYATLACRDIPAVAADLNAEIDRCAQGAVTDFYGREKRLDEDALDKFRQLLEETTVAAGADEALLSMMGDEAAYFFAGEKTAEEVAAILNDRVGLYLMEQG